MCRARITKHTDDAHKHLSRFYQDELRLYEYGLQLFNGMIQYYGEKYVDAEKRYRELRSKQKVLVHTAD